MTVEQHKISARAFGFLFYGCCWCFVISLAVAIEICHAAVHPVITPFREKVSFYRASAQDSAPQQKCYADTVWTAEIRDESGKPIYKLTLEPMCMVGGYVIGVDLLLKDADRPNEYNLLCPDDVCIGLQKFDFNARDFVHGPDKSIFGAKRTMSVPGRNIVVTATVLNVVVSPISGTDDFQLEHINFDVYADYAQGRDKNPNR